jgi:signal transduction histidine kinase
LAALSRMHYLSTKALGVYAYELLLQEIMDAAVSIMKADKGTLQLIEGDSLRIVAHHGHDRPFLDFFAAAENVTSVCGEATKRAERVVVEDVESSTLFAGTPSLAILRDAGVRAVQSTPLLSHQGELLGILTTQWGVPHAPDEHDLWRIDMLVRLAADLIEHKKAEEALKQLNEELENKVMQRTAELREKDHMLIVQSRHAAMGEMIGNIAHQWRQPLNTLGLQLQQLPLLYDMGQFNKELLANNVAASMGIIRHMSKTIDDFRNYFMPDKEKVNFNVHESVKASLSLLEGILKNPPIAVEVIVKDDPVIYGYQNEFAQVILNIMNNARDVFIERAIGEPKVTITIYREESGVVITVADNAGGIAGDIISKVFDPYFTTKGPQQGTGVGLFMSKTIIEKNMGGRLNVRNSDDGAEFRIEVGHGNPNQDGKSASDYDCSR